MIVTLVNFSKSKRKDLGAFYTPMPYAKKAAELVQMAVERVPKENDYIILDRCAGTGNLECALIGLKDKNGDDLISHCVVSTYEYYEYKVLQERIGSDVREIIPPTEANVVYENGRVANADAMSEDFINNPIIKQYIDNPKCSIILFENPPFRDVTSNSTGVANNQNSFVLEAMRKKIKGAILNDLTNRFIWSGWEYYLKKEYDAYIVFGPVKYFKTCDLCNKEFIKGFLFNRFYFHATKSAVSCILWFNKDCQYEELKLSCFDIADNENKETEKLIYIKGEDKTIKKAHSVFSKLLYDKRTFNSDCENGICCNLDGTERLTDKNIRVKKIYNKNILAYVRASSSNFDVLSRQLLRCTEYDGNGFYLRSDNYLDKLPLWVAKHVPLDKWYEKDIYATTADGGNAYTKDQNFLKSCLIYTCLSNQNKCLSFDGSDGRRYQNELCFDNKALALKDLKKYQANKITALDDEEKDLLKIWDKIISEARETKNYNPEFNYGIYQISKELNTFTVTGSGKNKKRNYDYIDLNSDLITLRTKLKQYYKSHITQKMFKYELLK